MKPAKLGCREAEYGMNRPETSPSELVSQPIRLKEKRSIKTHLNNNIILRGRYNRQIHRSLTIQPLPTSTDKMHNQGKMRGEVGTPPIVGKATSAALVALEQTSFV